MRGCKGIQVLGGLEEKSICFFPRLVIAATGDCMKPEKEAQPTGSGEGPQMN